VAYVSLKWRLGISGWLFDEFLKDVFDLFLLSGKGKTTATRDVTTVGICAYVDLLKLSFVFGNKQISLLAFSVISGFALLFTE